MVVREHIREIGILKALGAARWHVLSIFLSEALMLSLIGGGLGVVGGLTGASLIIEVLASYLGIRVPPVMDPNVMASGLLTAAVVGLLSGLYPSWRGASIRPVEALRYE